MCGEVNDHFPFTFISMNQYNDILACGLYCLIQQSLRLAIHDFFFNMQKLFFQFQTKLSSFFTLKEIFSYTYLNNPVPFATRWGTTRVTSSSKPIATRPLIPRLRRVLLASTPVLYHCLLSSIMYYVKMISYYNVIIYTFARYRRITYVTESAARSFVNIQLATTYMSGVVFF